MSTVDDLIANSQRYARDFEAAGASKAPALRLAVVACMDARLNLYGLLGIGEGDVHIIRNAGGVVTDDAIRSIVISQRFLGTTEIMLVHHTDCGMLTFRDDDLRARIEAETGVRPPFTFEAFPDVDADVRQSMARIKASPFVPHRDAIRGFVYEIETGRLREVV
ncbi:MAG: carbonic anhydrase [Actinobacteria bacterium]|nr:carbonic anhydrase [Actinomycetota bacterium]